jgi:leucyl aminopeptidase
MNVLTSSATVSELNTPLLAVPVTAGDSRGAAFEAANAATQGRLSAIANEEGYKGKPGTTLLVHPSDLGARRMLLVGIGKAEALEVSAARSLAATAVQAANARQLDSATVLLPAEMNGAAAAAMAAEGAVLGGYRYDVYLTEDVDLLTCESITLTGTDGDLGAAVERASGIADAVATARDLVNGPPADVTPAYLASVAKGIAEDGGLECTVFDKAAIIAEGMNLLMGVGCGSVEEPRFIHLTYRPEGATDDTPSIALVGKGVTFDAGGYNVKPTGHIEEMKMDMAGAAAVLGAMKALKTTQPDVIVHGIVPAAENLISGDAYKPGDVIRSLNGKTVEIMNTDAEGRLILADALCYAERLGVDRIVDLATLTGACMVALGPHTAAVFSNDDGFASRVCAAADSAGEDVWHMPLTKKLRPMLKSPIADMKNIGQRWGGAITAALFLSEFVGDVTWVHMDIAGPAFAEKSEGHIAKGGTGFGVATLVELLEGEL